MLQVRFTVEQNAILPNVPDEKVAALLKEPAVNGKSRFSVAPGNVIGHTISCTGSQFCGLALVETKANADMISRKLDLLVDLPKPLRIHWTGCPNSCGQVQVADIGLMGGPAKKLDPQSGKAKAVPGVKMFLGGTIGETGRLVTDTHIEGVPIEDLVPYSCLNDHLTMP